MVLILEWRLAITVVSIVLRATPRGARDYFQRTPCGLYLGQCLVIFSLNLEVLYVAVMSTGAFGRPCWVCGPLIQLHACRMIYRWT